MWAGLNGFDPRNNLVPGSVRIDMGCMNLAKCYFRVYAGTLNLNNKTWKQRSGEKQGRLGSVYHMSDVR